CRFGAFVVEACAPFGNCGGDDLFDDLFDCGGGGTKGRGTAHVTNGTEPDGLSLQYFVRDFEDKVGMGPDDAISFDNTPVMSKIYGGDFEFFFLYIIPDIKFCPV